MAQRALPSFDELYREIERLPQGVTGEIVTPGTLRTMSRPGSGHRKAGRQLFDALGGADRERRGTGFWIEVEAEIRFPLGRLLVPDLSAWRVERVPVMPRDNPLLLLPDFVCEVLFPSTAQIDRHHKLPIYIASGVEHVWLVDPEARLVEVYVPRDGKPLLAASLAENEVAALPPFDLDLVVERLWLPPIEPPPTPAP